MYISHVKIKPLKYSLFLDFEGTFLLKAENTCEVFMLTRNLISYSTFQTDYLIVANNHYYCNLAFYLS